MHRPALESLIEKINTPRLWDREPVFCFTCDVDWASEDVLGLFLSEIDQLDLRPTVFVTHASSVIEDYGRAGRIESGIHPNFLPGSSHGDDFRSVIESCLGFAPEARCFRSHKLFDTTDVAHLMKEYNILYASNLATILQHEIRPVLHESGLIRFPIFFEDGTHLYNALELRLERYIPHFTCPGIKVITMHPLDFVINTPTLEYSREIKDSLSREAYRSMSLKTIERYRHAGLGITSLLREIFHLAGNHRIMSLSEMYALAIS